MKSKTPRAPGRAAYRIGFIALKAITPRLTFGSVGTYYTIELKQEPKQFLVLLSAMMLPDWPS
jgi:hypothetical protein